MPSNKKTEYFAEAERLFIVENYTLEDIANKLPVTTRTLIDWKKEGDWDRKRRELAKQKEAFHVELYEFSRILLRKVRTDMEAGKDASSGQLYALTNLLGIV